MGDDHGRVGVGALGVLSSPAMILDGRKVPSGSVIETEVCVVGAGAAGITLALQWLDAPFEVVLLEGGGPEENPEAQELYRGESVGQPYYDLHHTRYRMFGGSTDRWAGWCRPLDPIDLLERSWVPGSGWPFGYEELAAWYKVAAGVCELPSPDFDPEVWSEHRPDLYDSDLFGGEVRTLLWQGSPPTKFGRVYRGAIERAARVRAYLHANVTEIVVGENGRTVTGLKARSLSGGEWRLEAKLYVLALGGIETPRLMLASNQVVPGGVGNAGGLVGRYFMEHPHVSSGRVVLSSREPGVRPEIPSLDRGLGGSLARLRLRRPSGDTKWGFGIEESLQTERKVLNFSAQLIPSWRARLRYALDDPETYDSIRLLLGNLRSLPKTAWQVRHRRLPRGAGTHLSRVIRRPGDLARVVWSEMLRRPSVVEVFAQTEQAPNPDSRVTLSEDRDALGMPRVRLDWRLSPIDRESIRINQEILGRAMEQAGIGRVEHARWLESEEEDWGADLGGGHHHMGTTRMSDDPTRGVVDRWGRVHGMENLYVAGPSVFPTGGFANPVLTVVALSARLADRVRSLWPALR